MVSKYTQLSLPIKIPFILHPLNTRRARSEHRLLQIRPICGVKVDYLSIFAIFAYSFFSQSSYASVVLC